MAELRRVFRSADERFVDACIARLCVLYEDLRIELFGISADSIPRLDVLDPAERQPNVQEIGKYRRNYFLRRSIGTLFEFSEGLRLLNACAELSAITSQFDQETRELWENALQFFASQEDLIKKVRNDIGGHFGAPAARYAVSNLSPHAVGKIEVRCDGERPRDPHLHFAGEIAATASLRHLPGKDTHEQVETFISGILVEAYRHATSCVQVLLALHLWPAFGR